MPTMLGLLPQSNGESRAALEPGTSLDAKLVLLTFHAKLIQPSVVNYFKLEAASD